MLVNIGLLSAGVATILLSFFSGKVGSGHIMDASTPWPVALLAIVLAFGITGGLALIFYSATAILS